jgi:CBS domain-containing protein
MKIAEVCTRDVVATKRATSLTDASKLMRENHVGSVIVVDDSDPRKPVGIVTDRDIVVEVVAAGLDVRTMTVGEIMTGSLITAGEDDDALATLKAMRRRGIRRIPIVDGKGALVGIVSLDDLLEIAGGALHDVMGAIASERSLESWRRR